jgi:hypothetical protein
MATSLPGWQSLGGATKWHRGFEIAGFWALGLLLLFEILAYVYGNRRDSLAAAAAAADLAAVQQRQQAEQQAATQRDAEIADAKRQATEAKEAQQRAEERAAPRHLTQKQKETLHGVLSTVPGTTIELTYLSDQETSDFAKEVIDVIVKSGWNIDQLTTTGMYIPPTYGVVVDFSEEQKNGIVAKTLMAALQRAGIAYSTRPNSLPHVHLFIALKP